METITSWALSVCGAAIGCSVVLMLAPKGGLGNLLRLAVSAVLLICIVRPLGEIISADDEWWKIPNIEAKSSELNDTVEEQLCMRVEQAVYDLCVSQYGDAVEKVEAVTDISETDGIYMKHIRVYTKQDAAHKTTVIQQFLERETGLTVEMELYDE